MYTTDFRFLWPCIVSKLWSERENQQDATIQTLIICSCSSDCIQLLLRNIKSCMGQLPLVNPIFFFRSFYSGKAEGRWNPRCNWDSIGYRNKTSSVTTIKWMDLKGFSFTVNRSDRYVMSQNRPRKPAIVSGVNYFLWNSVLPLNSKECFHRVKFKFLPPLPRGA